MECSRRDPSYGESANNLSARRSSLPVMVVDRIVCNVPTHSNSLYSAVAEPHLSAEVWRVSHCGGEAVWRGEMHNGEYYGCVSR